MRGKLGGWKFRKSHGRIIPAHAGQTMACTPSMPNLSDHPRACGANDIPDVSGFATTGSSPRMRGKQRHANYRKICERIIPAHAGQTRLTALTPYPTSDHPRACGANRGALPVGLRLVGSSPRMRGKRFHLKDSFFRCRIIPAHAGQTTVALRMRRHRPDHPRACGANSTSFVMVLLVDGSSPRMRGKPGVVNTWSPIDRIIPAHAGQTISPHPQSDVPADHPRACGANFVKAVPALASAGSSPRMRGKPVVFPRGRGNRRIIPAHAGQTLDADFVVAGATDHPRACGANDLVDLPPPSGVGSSPRMRGKRLTVGRCGVMFRIIPAHAGQTPSPSRRGCRRPDHPRACGANPFPLRTGPSDSGSSPRMRGKHLGADRFNQRGRIIPAHAGQTPSANGRRSRATDHPRACGANL